jgi:predicted dinucleotide-binding enzyme
LIARKRSMNVGIIGSGNVGGTLGVRWAHNGHSVVFSSRNPQSEEMKQLTDRAGAKARAATVREVASASEVILLATVWKARRDALASAGDVRGKILIDAMNPLLGDLSGLGARRKTSWKNPGFEGGKVFLPYCGNDGESKSRVHALATELGFDAFNVGP